MTAEVIEGTAERAVVVSQPGQAIVASSDATGPTDMLARASTIATALAAMVEKQRLYTLIRGKKFPNVEAWQTIGRMDNVVAREAERPVRNDDGSWEAFVELVRLSDGMVIGNGSALCGAERDGDWTKRPDHEKRSMAVTRATSRAFRQQYAWIMALAGYEPTPADEMPDRDQRETRQSESVIGTAATQGTQDYELRESPDGLVLPFRVKDGRSSVIVVAEGPMATALKSLDIIGQRVEVWGNWTEESFNKDGRKVRFNVLHAARVKGADFEVPSPDAPPAEPNPDEGGTGLFDAADEAVLEKAGV